MRAPLPPAAAPAERRRSQLRSLRVLAAAWIAGLLLPAPPSGAQDPPRPGNLTECQNWYDEEGFGSCAQLFDYGYTCDDFAPGTDYAACARRPRAPAQQSCADPSDTLAAALGWAVCDASCNFGPCCAYANGTMPDGEPGPCRPVDRVARLCA